MRVLNQILTVDTMVASVFFRFGWLFLSGWMKWVRVEIKMEVVVTMVVAADFGGE